MGILQIQDAAIKGTHLLIQVFGPSVAGKTRSALLMARGIVGPQGKIGGICTEAGRMRLHAPHIPGGFRIGELTPPFTPGRYKQAIQEMLEDGCDILVIDSFSHVWNAQGGVLDTADHRERSGLKGKLKWLHKTEYNSLTTFITTTKMHIILCSRGKQLTEEVPDPKRPGKSMWVKQPYLPIQDDALRYEMTIVLPMRLKGAYDLDERLKVPEEIASLFDGNPPTVELGRHIGDWVQTNRTGGARSELLRLRADAAADLGIKSYEEFFKSLGKDDRALLMDSHEDRKSRAKHMDEERADVERALRDQGPQQDPFSLPAGGPPQGSGFGLVSGSGGSAQNPAAERVSVASGPEVAAEGAEPTQGHETGGPGSSGAGPTPETFVLALGGDEIPYDHPGEALDGLIDGLERQPSAEDIQSYVTDNKSLLVQLKDAGADTDRFHQAHDDAVKVVADAAAASNQPGVEASAEMAGGAEVVDESQHEDWQVTVDRLIAESGKLSDYKSYTHWSKGEAPTITEMREKAHPSVTSKWDDHVSALFSGWRKKK